MFGLLTVHGTFRLKTGQVGIAADPGASSVQASIAAGSYASGNARRDANVVSADLLDAKAFPEITFTGQGARRDGDGWVLPGSVTAHGTSGPPRSGSVTCARKLAEPGSGPPPGWTAPASG